VVVELVLSAIERCGEERCRNQNGHRGTRWGVPREDSQRRTEGFRVFSVTRCAQSSQAKSPSPGRDGLVCCTAGVQAPANAPGSCLGQSKAARGRLNHYSESGWVSSCPLVKAGFRRSEVGEDVEFFV